MTRSRATGPLVACLLLAPLLGGCVVGVGRRGAPGTYEQAADSHSNLCIRNPRLCEELAIGEASGLIVRQRVAEVGASVYAAAEGVRALEEAVHRKIEQIILDCVLEADFQVNERHFGGNPTREQCQEVLGHDAQGTRITRAMLLGREKHEAAIACIQAQLTGLRPNGFSLNQRYRYNKTTGRWEPLSPKQEEALLRAGGEGLLGTLVPDVVLHTGSPAEVMDVYDLKFPCPGTNSPNWYTYPEGHPHQGWTQGQMYQRAFGGDPARVAPRWGVLRRLPK
ncbi:MAG TPA: hypothetical protein VF815_35500 [Myxococcaceae bacterium]